MTRTTAILIVAGSTSVVIVIGLLVAQVLCGGREGTGTFPPGLRQRSGAMLRFRPTSPGSGEWEPLRITVSELRAHGLCRWPNAPGVYFAPDDSLHCRRCVADPCTRAEIVADRNDNDRMLVLFGGTDERALVDVNCATHEAHGHEPSAATPRRGPWTCGRW